MTTVVTETPSVEITKLARDLRGMGGQISRDVGKGFKSATMIVARAAQRNASWSTRIPPAIKVRAARSRVNPGADIVVGGIPHGRLYEGLTKRGRKKFRHPVYGNRSVWVAQSTRPYLRPATKANLPAFRAAVDTAVRDVAKANGFS